MQPYYQHGGIVIYHGDCREYLEQVEGIRSQSFDLILTDPPYGLGDRWSGGTWASDPMYAEAKQWDVLFPSGDLLALIALAKHAVIWGGNYYHLPPTRCWLSWEKSSQMPTMADFELAWTNLDRPSKSFREDRNADGKRYHPTQKPESLMLWAMTQAPASNSIFDPFLGSGTTLVAAKRVGRRAVGIEVSEKYCEIAAKRLSQEALPLEVA